MRVIVAGGGTGGHIYPAIAIAKGIIAKWPDSEVLYVGTSGGMESRIVPEAEIPFAAVTARGWQGRTPGQLIKALAAVRKGETEAQKIMEDYAPQAVIGTGGYVCLPVAAAAIRKKIPVFLHEQNAYPGLTNRLISIWAQGIMTTFEEAAAHFPPSVRKKIVLTGLPVRQEIASANREEACARMGLDPGKLTILAVGGSTGARSMNLAMLSVIRHFYEDPAVQILHACGQRDHEMMRQRLEEAGISYSGEKNIHLRPYIDEMQYALGAADLCIGRAGAAFLAEMTLCGIPGILIPYPYASGDHQTYNARSLEQKQAAVVIEDKSLNGEVLLKRIQELLMDGSLREKMRHNSRKAARPEALDSILQVLSQIKAKIPENRV